MIGEGVAGPQADFVCDSAYYSGTGSYGASGTCGCAHGGRLGLKDLWAGRTAAHSTGSLHTYVLTHSMYIYSDTFYTVLDSRARGGCCCVCSVTSPVRYGRAVAQEPRASLAWWHDNAVTKEAMQLLSCAIGLGENEQIDTTTPVKLFPVFKTDGTTLKFWCTNIGSRLNAQGKTVEEVNQQHLNSKKVKAHFIIDGLDA